ncbi:MAG: phosphotransferase [Planctomycetes bacterium]|nr:phosphotransferase [Planctomycetota bacterium]
MMATPSLDRAAREVLAWFPFLSSGVDLIRLGNAGGFTGARFWRVEGTSLPLCLRAWPSDGPSPERLAGIHRCMYQARISGLDFVPEVLTTTSRSTWVEHLGKLWELTSWMPGQAGFGRPISPSRFQTAFAALAQVHLAWARGNQEVGECPAVRRRLHCAREWIDLLEAGWRLPAAAAEDRSLHPWAERAWDALRRRVREVPRRLGPWLGRPLTLQPCLCDVREEHLLFDGERLSGLVDYGSVKRDHVAADLARLLGSAAGYDPDLRALGLRTYRALRPLSLEEETLVGVLDETGTLLGAANWLTWVYREKRVYEDRAAVVRRLAELVERLERWERSITKEKTRISEE